MPLQKSFSEQGRSSRTHQAWKRSKSHSSANTTTRQAPAPRPLDPVSEASKTKLHAFEFRPDVEVIDIADDDEDDGGKDPAAPKANQKSAGHVAEEKNAAPPAAETPRGRLAWQDLIGLPNTAEEEADNSPNERILWETKRDENAPSPLVTRKRGKKRARSSSPVSSPSSRSKPATPALNVKKLSQALKSSHADPALDLWDRYTLNGSSTVTPRGGVGANPALAQIMVSSSPQTSKLLPMGVRASGTPGSGLRRAISCGTNWPKRRRVDRPDGPSQPEVAQDQSPSVGMKSSMVNALLKSVNGELNRSKLAHETRSDVMQSPSLKKKQRQDELDRRRPPLPVPPPPIFKSPAEARPSEEHPPDARMSDTLQDDFSDFGDDDFDEDTLMVLDASMAPPCEEPVAAVATINTRTGSRSETVSISHEKSDDDEFGELDDEFGDLDDDVFAAAEGLIAEIDSSHTANTRTADAISQPVAEQQLISSNPLQDAGGGDLYGDDFGEDFDFEAAEISATQAVQQTNDTSPSIPPVRRRQ